MNSQQAMAEHRARYPEQYNHPLCGKTVRVKKRGEPGASGNAALTDVSGKVERVVTSRFGQLASLEGREDAIWWLITDLEQTDAQDPPRPRRTRR